MAFVVLWPFAWSGEIEGGRGCRGEEGRGEWREEVGRAGEGREGEGGKRRGGEGREGDGGREMERGRWSEGAGL